ncbi:MAG: hydroxymethylbilane synthase [Pseudomonadota bacterium]
MREKFYIGTRGSALALCQAQWVKTQLARNYPERFFELVIIKTTGDKILDVPLSRVGGKGLFVKEIEEALLNGKIDLAVHSMKDVPTIIPSGLVLGVITKRENPLDVLIAREHKRLEELPQGACIGTSSLRRQAQILHVRPDVRIKPLRGNLDTRLKKLEAGGFDGIIVAAAGIMRMGWEGRITEYLSPSQLLPAIGQGALGIETRRRDQRTNEIVAFLHHPETAHPVMAERAFLKRLEGGCQVPIAALGTMAKGRVSLEGLIGSLDGKVIVRDTLEGELKESETIGVTLAERLLSSGGKAILEEIYGMEKVTEAKREGIVKNV